MIIHTAERCLLNRAEATRSNELQTIVGSNSNLIKAISLAICLNFLIHTTPPNLNFLFRLYFIEHNNFVVCSERLFSWIHLNEFSLMKKMPRVNYGLVICSSMKHYRGKTIDVSHNNFFCPPRWPERLNLLRM